LAIRIGPEAKRLKWFHLFVLTIFFAVAAKAFVG
jgi:hypothetical protein